MKSRAFSLVEVLIVVAIIAIVAALLFPEFNTVKRSAKSVSCLSNLHQIGLASQMYARDNDDATPVTFPLAIPSTGKSLDPLSAYGVTRDIYHCPDYRGERASPNYIDYSLRFVIFTQKEGSTDPFRLWKITPESNSVIAYCTWNMLNPNLSVGGADGTSINNGCINALRYGGSVQRIATGLVKEHNENWYGFPDDADPNCYRWLQFPDEPFPPALQDLGQWP